MRLRLLFNTVKRVKADARKRVLAKQRRRGSIEPDVMAAIVP
jgi:hypothetical protein